MIRRYNVLCIALILINVVVYLMDRPSVWGNFRIVYMFLLWPSLIWGAVQFKWVERILTVKPLLKLGKLSNSIFIWHHPVLYIIYSLIYMNLLHINLRSFGVFCVIFLLILVVAFVSNQFLEGKVFRMLMGFFKEERVEHKKER